MLVQCKICGEEYQITERKVLALIKAEVRPICGDACLESHYSHLCSCTHCKNYRLRGTRLSIER